jgi:hypothetical protein
VSNDRFLTEEEVEAYNLMLLMDGPDDDIKEILEKDRADRLAWKYVASRLKASASCSAPPLPNLSIQTLPVAQFEKLPLEIGATTEPKTSSATALPLPEVTSLQRAIATVSNKGSRELRDVLSTLTRALHPQAAKRKPHKDVRKWIWAINTVLTQRDEGMPCARSQPKLGRAPVKSSAMTDGEKLMLNDRQMFDLEFAHKNQLGNPKRRWETLLRSEQFDPGLAAKFITTVGGPDKKVDALGLRDDEQMQLAAIRSEAVRKRWERTQKEAGRLVDVLRAAAAAGRSKISEAEILTWREDYVALVVAKGSPSAASVLLRRLFAREKPANQLSNRKADLLHKGFPTS